MILTFPLSLGCRQFAERGLVVRPGVYLLRATREREALSRRFGHALQMHLFGWGPDVARYRSSHHASFVFSGGPCPLEWRSLDHP
jgi:hypothetical protein